jgi:hypothetical protein
MLSLISSLLLFFLVSSPFFFWLPKQGEQPTEDMATYMHYNDHTEMKNTMLDDDMSQLINNDNLQEFSSYSDRLGLFSLFLVFFIFLFLSVLCSSMCKSNFCYILTSYTTYFLCYLLSSKRSCLIILNLFFP